MFKRVLNGVCWILLWYGDELTHPDDATLVDPLCFAKGVKIF